MDLLKFPLARFTIWFVIGIVIGHFTMLDRSVIFALTGVAFLLFTATYFISQRSSRQKIYFGICLSILCFFVGITNETIHRGNFRRDNYTHHATTGTVNRIDLTIRERLKSNGQSRRYIAVVNAVGTTPTSGKILLTIRSTTDAEAIGVGTNLIATGTINRHIPPLNPDQFDYGKYLENKSVYAQVYLGPKDYRLLKKPAKDIWYYSDRVRDRIVANLEKSGFEGDNLHVANALILGQQQEISKDILRDYQFAGAVHILSVSGLHVGFILIFLNLALRPLPKNKRGRIIKFAVILFSLWGFAILAGLSPSVVRSATMFSFIAFGMSIRRGTNIFHTLIVSLLLILLVEPSFLFDVGFQLSYFALFFILWLQPFLSDLWRPGNRIGNYFWDIVTVSLAAQVGAFPLSVYYFHQFPGLFFITNLIIIPFVNVIMLIGISVMLMAFFGVVFLWPLKLLEWSISAMNAVVSKIASYESFILQDIPLNIAILLSLYLSIFAAVWFIKKPKLYTLANFLGSLLICQITIVETLWRVEQEKEFTVFNTRKSSNITERNGRNITLYNQNPATAHPIINSYTVANFGHIDTRKKIPNLLFFDKHKILLIDSTAVYPTQAEPDILILTQSPKINLDRLIQTCHPKTVVADASNYKSYCNRWEATCNKNKIPFHNTSEKGFFRIKK